MKKHTRLFASILVLVGILVFAVSPVLSVSAAPVFQDPIDPPTDPLPPADPDPVIVVPQTGEQQQTFDASWIIWLVIGIVVIILLVALLARDRPRL